MPSLSDVCQFIPSDWCRKVLELWVWWRGGWNKKNSHDFNQPRWRRRYVLKGNGKRLLTSVVAVCTAETVVTAVAEKNIEDENRRATQQPLHRSAHLSPVKGGSNTPWLQMVLGSTSLDFIYILPLFKLGREKCNWVSPYRNGQKATRRPETVSTIDILGRVSWGLKRILRQKE